MYQSNKRTYLFTSLIIAVLLSLSPFFVLMEHHQWLDVVDKSILLLTAFLIALANLFFQTWLQTNPNSTLKSIVYTAFFNIGLWIADILVRIPFWNLLAYGRPPLPFLIAVDLVRNIIIGVVAYVIIAFLIKNAKQIAYKAKINNLENQTLQLQLTNLTAQLQPHFFFNSLNILSELIYIDTQKSDAYIQHLSNIFRYVLTNQETPFVQLNNEIGFIHSYLYLLQIRFNNALEITYVIEENLHLQIPSLCCLIVLENIVKHNNINNMHIKIYLSSDRQFLVIANTKNKKNKLEVNSLGYGLANINKKCDLLLKRSIHVHETIDLFEVSIPLCKVA